jgi:hypothetical protein
MNVNSQKQALDIAALERDAERDRTTTNEGTAMGKIFWWTDSRMLYSVNAVEPNNLPQLRTFPYADLRGLIRDGYIEVSRRTAAELGYPS